MSATATTAKLSVLVTPATKRELEAEARAKRVTVGELVRQRISGEPGGDEQAFFEALAALGKRAKSIIDKMDTRYAATQAERARWPEREAEIRQRVLTGLTESDRVVLGRIFGSLPSGAQA